METGEVTDYSLVPDNSDYFPVPFRINASSGVHNFAVEDGTRYYEMGSFNVKAIWCIYAYILIRGVSKLIKQILSCCKRHRTVCSAISGQKQTIKALEYSFCL